MKSITCGLSFAKINSTALKLREEQATIRGLIRPEDDNIQLEMLLRSVESGLVRT